MTPTFELSDILTRDLVTREFLSDIIGIAALAVTTTIILWLPAILQA